MPTELNKKYDLAETFFTCSNGQHRQYYLTGENVDIEEDEFNVLHSCPLISGISPSPQPRLFTLSH